MARVVEYYVEGDGREWARRGSGGGDRSGNMSGSGRMSGSGSWRGKRGEVEEEEGE